MEELRKRLHELESDYDKFVALVKSRGYKSIEAFKGTNYEEEVKQRQYLEARKEIDDLRQRYTAELLRSMESSSKSLAETTVKLKESADSQAEATQQLERGSRRLNALTNALLILTAVLAVAGTGSYTLQVATQSGYTGQDAVYLTGSIVMIVVVAIILSFEVLVRRAKRESSLR